MSTFKDFMTGKCPRCGKGKVFVSRNPYNLKLMLATNKECSECHLDFIGFTFLISTLIFGFMNSLNIYYVGVNAVLLVIFSPVFFRFSRMLWLWLNYKAGQ